ncbi:MAG: hypothetical protein ACRDPA_09140 [Solirubrobacteraceae bacterium]
MTRHIDSTPGYWVVIVFAVRSTDRIFYRLGISYTTQIHVWRVGIWVIPIIVFLISLSACRSLQRSRAPPLRAWQGEMVRRWADGAIEVVASNPDRVEPEPTEPPVGTVPGHESPD